MNGVIDWFVGTLRSLIMWQIAIFTVDINSMILLVAAFDAMLLTFVVLLFFGGSKFRPVVQVAVVGMAVVSIVTVALVR